MTFATYEEAMEVVDDWATDNPLEALREYAEWLTPYRLDACATAEPAAALLYAHDLLTPERRAACEAAAPLSSVARYVPDRLSAERRRAKALLEGRA
jgi:hypothetical protein